jgi:hypothetical protein
MNAHAEKHIVTLTDVPVAPYHWRRPTFHGGIDAAMAPEHARIRRGPAAHCQPFEIERFTKGGFFRRKVRIPHHKGRYLFAGPLWNHFGHVMVDCIHRLWALSEGSRSYDGIVFCGVQGLIGLNTPARLEASKPPGYALELMDLIGLPKLPIIYLTKPATFETLDVPRLGTAPRANIAPFYRFYLDRYQDTLERTLADQIRNAPERLFLGRSHIIHKGGALGCSYFEGVLNRAGFATSRPEDLGLRAQIANLLGAKTVIADEGSALHPTQVFSRVETDYLMFPRRVRNEIYSDAISQRARSFANLAPPDQIIVLPDRYGKTSSAGCLAIYADPAAVFDELVRRTLVEEAFDAEAYHAAEHADLARCRQTGTEVLDTQRSLLDQRGKPSATPRSFGQVPVA